MRFLSVDPGLTSTGVWYHEPGCNQSFTLIRGKKENRYIFMARVRATLIEKFGKPRPEVGIVEDYPYGMDGNVLAATCEAGGIVRAALAELGTKFVAIPNSTWKSVMGFRMKKDTAEQRRDYCRRASEMQGSILFDSTDAADAYLMWATVDMILAREVTSETANRIRAALLEIIKEVTLFDAVDS